MTNGVAIEQLSDFNSIPEAQDISEDFLEGLDSWPTEDDKLMMDYVKHYGAGDHWFKLIYQFVEPNFVKQSAAIFSNR